MQNLIHLSELWPIPKLMGYFHLKLLLHTGTVDVFGCLHYEISSVI